jgi:hypothetical protein
VAAGASRDNLHSARIVTSAHCGRRQAVIRPICFSTSEDDFEYAAKSGWGEIRGQLGQLTYPRRAEGGQMRQSRKTVRPSRDRPFWVDKLIGNCCSNFMRAPPKNVSSLHALRTRTPSRAGRYAAFPQNGIIGNLPARPARVRELTYNQTLQALRLLSRVCTSAAILVMRQVNEPK